MSLFGYIIIFLAIYDCYFYWIKIQKVSFLFCGTQNKLFEELNNIQAQHLSYGHFSNIFSVPQEKVSHTVLEQH